MLAIDIHQRIEDHRFTVGRSRASRKKRRRGVERQWPTGATLLIPRTRHSTVQHVCNTHTDANAGPSGTRSRSTHAIPFHSSRALLDTRLQTLTDAARRVADLLLSFSRSRRVRSVPLRSFPCLNMLHSQPASQQSCPKHVRANGPRIPSSNQRAIRHFAAWNAFSFRKPARTSRPRFYTLYAPRSNDVIRRRLIDQARGRVQRRQGRCDECNYPLFWLWHFFCCLLLDFH